MTTRGTALTAGDRSDEPRGVAVLREHGPLLARVCMALLGDAAASERALERIAAEAGSARVGFGDDAKVRLLSMARVACSTQLSKLPIRTAAGVAPPGPTTASAAARGELGRLKPTEREAVVLHVIGGLDAAQVAAACGIDATTARTRLARGLAQLMQQEKQR
jgi:DNA-directed RNA polymerase specialized sigma24 family protein